MTKIDEGFVCECGQHHVFGVYIAAHWDERLIHTCDCGRKHSVCRGHVSLLKVPAKVPAKRKTP